MMTHRRLVVALAIGSAAAAAIVACSFPDVTFDSSGGDGGGPDTNTDPGDTSVTDGQADANGDSALPPDVDPDGGSQEASMYNEAGRIDAAGCTTCDCDNDTWDRDGGVVSSSGVCIGGPASGGSAPGFDCDDSDPALSPDAGFVESTMWPSAWTPTYDWNCDGVVTRQYPYKTTCPGVMVGGDCTTISGFQDDPQCGAAGTWITCKAFLTGCTVDTTKTIKTKKQTCK